MTATQLKNAILQYAIQGKLVSQNPNDEPASVLLEKIRKEKRALVKAGKIKKDIPVKPITTEEIPFEIPENWKWVRLGSVVIISGGGTPDKASPHYWNGNIPWASVKDMKGDELHHTINSISEKGLASKPSISVCEPGDLIVATRLVPGKSLVCKIRSSINQDLKRIQTSINEVYLHYWFMSTLVSFMKLGQGTTVLGIKNEDLEDSLLPLPPLAEQKRIVKRIEELLPLINDYGKAEQELTALDNEFSEKFKKSVLQTAIQGKLVPQDLNDEPASVLLERIRAERKRLIRDGKIKPNKEESVIFRRDNSHYEKRGKTEHCIDDEIPFDLPENWAWVRLESVVYNHGQMTPKDDFCYIDIGSIDNEQQKLNKEEIIVSVNKAPSRARKIVEQGDILYATVRPYLHNMCIVDKNFSKTPIASTGFSVMACYEGLFNRYLFFYLLSPDFDDYANDIENSKGVAYPAINDTKLYNALAPLPPLMEQRRIVACIDILFATCDRL